MKNFLLFIGLLSVVLIANFMQKFRTRGEKNNNPFNLNQSSSNWLGEVKPSQDSRFAQFESQELGLRAGLITLYNGYFSHNLPLTGILAKYAPNAENDTMAYVYSVCTRTGLEPLEVPKKNDWLKVASAILYHENGKQIASPDELKQVAKMYNLTYYI